MSSPEIRGYSLRQTARYLESKFEPEARRRAIDGLPASSRSMMSSFEPGEWYPREHSAALFRAMQAPFDAGLDEFKWFIYRFTTPTMKHLFAHPRDVLGVERAVVSMLAGDVFDVFSKADGKGLDGRPYRQW